MDDIRELREEAARTPFHGTWTKGGPVFSWLPDEAIRGMEGRSIASFGDSATLGMWAFATGIWTTGLFQTNILPTQDMILLFPQLLVYSGLVEFIAGLFLYRRNNTFVASALCSFAALNITQAVLLICETQGLVPAGGSAGVLRGCLLESFAYIALSLLIGAVRINLVLVLVLICTFLGFALAGLPLITGQPSGGWAEAGHIGGYFMFGSGFFAYYGGTALLVNSAWRRTVLPIGGQA